MNIHGPWRYDLESASIFYLNDRVLWVYGKVERRCRRLLKPCSSHKNFNSCTRPGSFFLFFLSFFSAPGSGVKPRNDCR